MLKGMLKAAEGSGSPNPLIPDMTEMIVVLICFLVLLFLVYKFVVPNFEKIYNERKEAIQGGLEKAAKAQAEADEAKAQYEKQLRDAKDQGAEIREKAKNEGAQIIAESREQAQLEANRISEQSKKQVLADKETAQRQLKTDVGSLATQLAGIIVGESLEDDDRSNRVIDRFLADLEASQKSSSN